MVRHLIALSLVLGLTACGMTETKSASAMPSDISANYWNSSYYTVLSANSTGGTTVKPIKLQ